MVSGDRHARSKMNEITYMFDKYVLDTSFYTCTAEHIKYDLLSIIKYENMNLYRIWIFSLS